MEQNPTPDGDNKPQDAPERKDSPSSNQPARQKGQDATEQVEHQVEHAKWGHLPEYVESVKSRGGQPDVPERYRRFRDAFLKQSQGDNKK